MTGASFTQGVIVVSGRATDDQQIARVEVGIIDSLGRYMSSSGTFTSTTPSYRTAFLNSPGSLGSNFAYTSPVIPAGRVLGGDHGRPTSTASSACRNIVTSITVTQPANTAAGGRPRRCRACRTSAPSTAASSTDEDTSTLTYSWSFGQGGGSTSPLPIKTYTAAGHVHPDADGEGHTGA